MEIADRTRADWTAEWIAKGVSIAELVDAFMGGDTVFADRQLVVTRTFDPAGLCFSGEIDATNRGSVATCLSTVEGLEDDIHLDVTGLIFCDISGIRAFVEAAEHRKTGRLVLDGLPELLQTVMRVTGWADLPNLFLSDGKAGAR